VRVVAVRLVVALRLAARRLEELLPVCCFGGRANGETWESTFLSLEGREREGREGERAEHAPLFVRVHGC
jgi:hypothetical protein